MFRGREKKLYMGFVDLEKAFDRVPRKVMEWALRKKSLPKVLVKAVMSLYEGSRTKVRVGSGLLEEFGVRVGVHQGSVISPLIFVIVVDAVTEQARKGLLNETLYMNDLVLMSEHLEDLRERFQRWRGALESKGMKVNTRKTKIMVSGAEGEIVRSKVDPRGICGKRVMSHAVLCTVCKKWIHAKCAQTKKVSCSFAQQFICRRCEDIGDGKEEPVEVLCDEVETVKGFCYLTDRLIASGGCETVVTARVKIGWMKFRECGDLLVGRRFSLKMKGMVYRSCVRSAMLYGSETWCLRENEMIILRRTERAMVRSMCGVKLVNRKNTEDLMKLLGLKETLDKMAQANGVRWCGHVVRRDEESILKKAMMLQANGQRKRGRPKQTRKRQVEENLKKIGLRVEEATDRARWREGVKAIAEGMRCIRPPSDTRKNRIKIG